MAVIIAAAHETAPEPAPGLNEDFETRHKERTHSG